MGVHFEKTMIDLKSKTLSSDVQVSDYNFSVQSFTPCRWHNDIRLYTQFSKNIFVFAYYFLQKSDEMKKKGNEHFQQQQYERAIKFYSKAIEFKYVARYYADLWIYYASVVHILVLYNWFSQL